MDQSPNNTLMKFQIEANADQISLATSTTE